MFLSGRIAVRDWQRRPEFDIGPRANMKLRCWQRKSNSRSWPSSGRIVVLKKKYTAGGRFVAKRIAGFGEKVTKRQNIGMKRKVSSRLAISVRQIRIF